MAEEIVSINNLKENILQFELTVEGLSTKDFDAKFVIHSSDMEMAFPCKKGDDNKWTVTLPPLPMLERTAYPFHLQVVAEGFQFRPMRGAVNVVGSPEVYAPAGVKNTKLESPSKAVAPVKETKASVIPARVDVKRGREKPVEQIARELMEANKTATKKTIEESKTVKVEPVQPKVGKKEALLPTIELEPKSKPDTSKKDQAARKVLEDLGIKVPKVKTGKRFSLKD